MIRPIGHRSGDTRIDAARGFFNIVWSLFGRRIQGVYMFCGHGYLGANARFLEGRKIIEPD